MPLGPDAITAQYFGGKNIQIISNDAGCPFDAIENADLIARLTGAPNGSLIEVWFYEKTGQVDFCVRNGALFELPSFRSLYREPSGLTLLVLENAGLFILPGLQDKGIGTRAVIIGLHAAAELGVDKVRTKAIGARDQPCKGYYVWPTLGFDADIPQAKIRDLPVRFSGARRLSELVVEAGGRAWWYDNGLDIEVEFDLHPESTSWAILKAYMTAKAIKL